MAPHAGLTAAPMRVCGHPADAIDTRCEVAWWQGSLSKTNFLLVPLAPKYPSVCSVPLMGRVLCQAVASWFLKLRGCTLPRRVSVSIFLSVEYTGL